MKILCKASTGVDCFCIFIFSPSEGRKLEQFSVCCKRSSGSVGCRNTRSCNVAAVLPHHLRSRMSVPVLHKFHRASSHLLSSHVCAASCECRCSLLPCLDGGHCWALQQKRFTLHETRHAETLTEVNMNGKKSQNCAYFFTIFYAICRVYLSVTSYIWDQQT